MGLNIKNEETHMLVRNLASLTGESMTTAIRVAVQERIERVEIEKKIGLADRLLAIGKAAAPMWREPFRSTEHGDLLYGVDGLPK
ncbi:MAG: type II toxin-antitoxin system VapB family antitoxin [Terracidiphilus sp.]|jgi:antitoxin VapB